VTSRSHILVAVAAALFFLAIALLLQWRAGAYSAELAGHPDEPAHYVTGLMLHDYLTTWPLAPPLRFAENFYVHYPKMAFGHWPPVFYIIQAAWTIPFSASRGSVLVLMAVLTMLLALVVYRAAAREFGAAIGAGCALLVILLPTVQEFAAMVMTEIPIALMCLLAALSYGRYLATGRWQDSAWFGLLAAIAIMTKGNALALALVPPLALVFSRRLELVREKSFWLAPLIVAVVCAPWYATTLRMQQEGWIETFDLPFLLRAFATNTPDLVRLTGPVLFLLAAAGIVVKVAVPWKARRVEPQWAALAALIASVWIFQSVVPVGLDIRQLVTAAAPLLLFAAAGTVWLAGRLRTRALYVGAATALLFAATTFTIPKKPHHGFGRLVDDLLAQPANGNRVVLVSSQYVGEGVVISEVARLEHRPGHVILRASKVLAQSEWTGANYHVLYPDSAAVMKYLTGIPTGVLVMDDTPGRKDHLHHHQLEEVLRDYPDRWQLIKEYSKNLRAYRLRSEGDRAPGKIRIDLDPMLGRTIEK
jgi:4-amino-4-deoxy-L-arabinose transferase-like glycosyltransferase